MGPRGRVCSCETVSRDLDRWIRDEQLGSRAQGLMAWWLALLLFVAVGSLETEQTASRGSTVTGVGWN
jgi:hypothetical protein